MKKIIAIVGIFFSLVIALVAQTAEFKFNLVNIAGTYYVNASLPFESASFLKSVVPTAAGGGTFGSAALPASGVYIGNAATNNAQITGTFAQATTLTVGDPGISAARLAVMPATGGQVTTNGTAVAAGTCQAQTPLTVTGTTTTSAVHWSVPTALPATWQTGIMVLPVVTANTVTLSLCNPTAGSITPAAQAVNVRVVL